MAGEWPVYRTKPIGKTYGFYLPMFVHNGGFHFTQLGVYADGLFDCWESLDRALFVQKVTQKWAAAFPKPGDYFSIFLLGAGKITEAEWSSTPQKIVEQADALLRGLNPSGENPLDLHGEASELRGKTRWSEFSLPDDTPYYQTSEGEEIPGKSLAIFAVRDNEYHLTNWFVFADDASRIGGETAVLTQADISARFASGLLATTAPKNAWIIVECLGRFRSETAHWYVDALERQKEAQDEIAMLNGGLGSRAVCVTAFEEYEAAPSDAKKEALRVAYEAVPEHLRMFCGDMDSKDAPIQAVLYGATEATDG